MKFEAGQRVRIVKLSEEMLSGIEGDLQEFGNQPLAAGRIGTVREADDDGANVLLDGDVEMVSFDASELEAV